MPRRDVVLGVDGEFQGVTDGLNRLRARLQALGAAARAPAQRLTAEFNAVENSIDGANAAVRRIQSRLQQDVGATLIERQNRAAQRLTGEARTVNRILGAQVDIYNRLVQQAREYANAQELARAAASGQLRASQGGVVGGTQLTRTLERRARAHREAAIATARELAATERLSDSHRELIREVERLTGASIRQTRAVQQTARSSRRVISTHERMRREARQLRRELDRTSAAFRRVGRGGSGAGGAAGAFGGELLGGLRNIARQLLPIIGLFYILRQAVFAVERAFRLLVRAGEGIARVLREGIEFGNELYISSRNLRIAISDLVVLRQTYESVGLSAEQAAEGVSEIQEQIGRALTGTPRSRRQARFLFRQLGLDDDSLRELARRPQAALDEVFRGLQELPTTAERFQVASQLLGDRFRALVGILDELVAAQDRARDRVERYGAATIEQAYATALLNQELAGFVTFMRQVRIVLSSQFLDGIRIMITLFSEWSGGAQNLGRNLGVVVEQFANFAADVLQLLTPLVDNFATAIRVWVLFRSTLAFSPSERQRLREEGQEIIDVVNQLVVGIRVATVALRNFEAETVSGPDIPDPPLEDIGSAIDTLAADYERGRVAARQFAAQQIQGTRDANAELRRQLQITNEVRRSGQEAADRINASYNRQLESLRAQANQLLAEIQLRSAVNQQVDELERQLVRVQGQMDQLVVLQAREADEARRGAENVAGYERAARFVENFGLALARASQRARELSRELSDVIFLGGEAGREAITGLLESARDPESLIEGYQRLRAQYDRNIQSLRRWISELQRTNRATRDERMELRGLVAEAEAVEQAYALIQERVGELARGRELAEFRAAWEQVALAIGDAFANLLVDLTQGIDDLRDYIRRIAIQLAVLYLSQVFTDAISRSFAGAAVGSSNASVPGGSSQVTITNEFNITGADSAMVRAEIESALPAITIATERGLVTAFQRRSPARQAVSSIRR